MYPCTYHVPSQLECGIHQLILLFKMTELMPHLILIFAECLFVAIKLSFVIEFHSDVL